ncbi:MAG TPA: phage holin family protein, partial [Acidimicrobiales bacterium]
MSEPNGAAAPVDPAPHVATSQGHGVRFFDVLRLLLTWGLTFLSLLLTANLLPGFTYTSWLPLAAAAAVAGVVGMIVRPVLVEVAAAIGWLAVAAAT